MTPEQMQAERNAFEREAREILGKHTDFSRDSFTDCYIDDSLDERWNGWMMRAFDEANRTGVEV